MDVHPYMGSMSWGGEAGDYEILCFPMLVFGNSSPYPLDRQFEICRR